MRTTERLRNCFDGSIDRRTFLAAGASLIAIGAASPVAAEQSPIALGSKELITLSDGHLTLPMSFVFGDVPQDELAALLAAHDLPADRVEPPCNVTMLRDNGRLVLFDVGAGPNFMASAGRLMESLEVAGIDPADVTDVLFTHAHPDHIWGLLDDFDDLAFAEADYHMARAEWDYWRADDTLANTPEARQSFVVGAQNRLAALEDRIRLFDFGDEVVAGVEAVDTSGHTPGHTAFAVHDGSDSVMIVGDALTNAVVSFARPDWPTGSDQDAQKGTETRTRLLDRLATDKDRMIGFHLPDGGVGRVERDGAGYRFVVG